jgi:hypothetical protein
MILIAHATNTGFGNFSQVARWQAQRAVGHAGTHNAGMEFS